MGHGDPDIATLKTSLESVSSSLDDESLLEMYRQMVLSRTLDERVWLLNRQGKAAIVASSQGHEAAQIATVWAMRKDRDLFYIYYRDLAVLISLGISPNELLLGFLAKQGEPFSSARQFPTHGAYPKYRVYNLSNVVGTQIPQAVGAALAAKMKGDDTVVTVYFGDGGSSQGDCHEAMNFAGIHGLPIIFLCENNRYAISVPLSRQVAGDSVAARAAGYGMPGVVVDGTDVVAVHEAMSAAVRRARDGDGPTLVEAMVERYLPHTSDDDDSRYRSKEELERARRRDPLELLRERLMGMGVLDDERDREIVAAARVTVDEATDYAEEAPYPGTDDFFEHVYAGGGPSP